MAEIMFDPQTHTARGVSFDTVITGLLSAIAEAGAKHGMTVKLILCFLRHLDEADAFAVFEQARPWLDRIAAVGLDSSELGHPPEKFARVFAQARAAGLRLVAHAGEEGPPEYVHQALDILGIDRLDHGNRSLEDPVLTARLARTGMTLTVCPLSNLKLCVVDDMAAHPIDRMLREGLRATVNSDDPAYFGGYVADNYRAVEAARGLTPRRSRDAGAQFVPRQLPARRGDRRPSGDARRLCGAGGMTIYATVTQEQFVADIRTLAAAPGGGTSGSRTSSSASGAAGWPPAAFLSHATGLPMLSVDYSSQVKDFADAPLLKLALRTQHGERLLFLDDINDSGRTITHLRTRLRDGKAAAGHIRFATLIDNVSSAETVDYRARQIDRRVMKDWFIFPWEAVAPDAVIAADAAAVSGANCLILHLSFAA